MLRPADPGRISRSIPAHHHRRHRQEPARSAVLNPDRLAKKGLPKGALSSTATHSATYPRIISATNTRHGADTYHRLRARGAADKGSSRLGTDDTRGFGGAVRHSRGSNRKHSRSARTHAAKREAIDIKVKS